MALYSNKHKIRGWKTQQRRVEQWRKAHLVPDWFHYEQYGVDYVKIQLDPWNRLKRREPPVWLCRQMLGALLDIHAAWRAALQARQEQGYLALWLVWPTFTQSQVIMAQPWRAPMYQNFAPVELRPLPLELGETLLGQMQAFDWRVSLDEFPHQLPTTNRKRRGMVGVCNCTPPQSGVPLQAYRFGFSVRYISPSRPSLRVCALRAIRGGR